MIIKSYLLEQDIKLLFDKNLFLFYGENLGLKNDFKNLIKLSSPDYKIININQDEVIKNQEKSIILDIESVINMEKENDYFKEKELIKIPKIAIIGTIINNNDCIFASFCLS